MADQNLPQLTELTSLTGDDLAYIVNDPGGTPADRKAQVSTLRQWRVDPRTSTVNLTAASAGEVITNEGATAQLPVNLPAAAANLIFHFYVQDADGIQITAAAGDTIRIGGLVSSGGGTCTSTLIGSFLTLLAVNGTEWVATFPADGWTLA